MSLFFLGGICQFPGKFTIFISGVLFFIFRSVDDDPCELYRASSTYPLKFVARIYCNPYRIYCKDALRSYDNNHLHISNAVVFHHLPLFLPFLP